jgi:hypothetical protein
MPDEEAFSLLVRLMSVYDLQGHFLPEMPKLQLRLVSEINSLFSCSSAYRTSSKYGTTVRPEFQSLIIDVVRSSC